MNRTLRHTALAAAVLAALGLAACNKAPTEPTVGQRVDGAATEVGKSATEAAGAVADTAKDIGITAKVNAALAGDSKLSAMRINVDTTAGRVTLSGTAPDGASRDRATTLASAVEGVSTVENRLTLDGKS